MKKSKKAKIGEKLFIRSESPILRVGVVKEKKQVTMYLIKFNDASIEWIPEDKVGY